MTDLNDIIDAIFSPSHKVNDPTYATCVDTLYRRNKTKQDSL